MCGVRLVNRVSTDVLQDSRVVYSIISTLICMYISYIIIYRICPIYKVSLTLDLKPRPLVLCSSVCSTELASLAQEQSSTVNIYTRSGIKEHELVYNIGN